MSSRDCDRKRPSWDEYFMNMAQLAATRATCVSDESMGAGALIVRDKTVLATGYNGSPRGLDHCGDIGHELADGHCVRTVHAEANALAAAAKNGVAINNATVYTTTSPCYECFKLLINAGISRIVCGSPYGANEKILALAAQADVKFEFLKADGSVSENSGKDTIKLNFSTSKTVPENQDVHGNIKLKIKKLHPLAILPNFAREGDAGLDLYSVEGLSVAPGERVKVATGVAMEIANGYVGMIWDRTGVSFKRGLKAIGGVVDSSYRGEVQVLLANISKVPVEIMQGEKIAQMVIQPFERPEIELSDSLSNTERKNQMFGSSDLKPITEDDLKKVIKTNKIEEDDGSQKSRW